MQIILPSEVNIIINSLTRAGFEAYAVGGCVRDSLLGLTPKDWDICTSATPQEIINLFSTKVIIPTGLQHGTVTLVLNAKPYEITTFRIDGTYKDNRHPDQIEFTTSLQQDLTRRDFTINAMAYNHETGLIDYFNGQTDLENKLIQCVGDPQLRFNEDGLRIMRGLRFAAVYGFSIAHNTQTAIHEYRYLLNNIAAERLNTELCLILVSQTPDLVLRHYSDVIGIFIPEILPMVGFKQHNPHHCFDAWEHTIHTVMNTPPQIELRLAALLHDIAKPQCFTRDSKGIGHFYGHAERGYALTDKIMTDLKFPKGTKHRVEKLVLFHHGDVLNSSKSLKKWLNKIGEQALVQLLQLKMADTLAHKPTMVKNRLGTYYQIQNSLKEILKEKQCFQLKDLAVNGTDLLKIGIPPGKTIGQVLNFLLQTVLEEKSPNEKDSLLAIAKDYRN